MHRFMPRPIPLAIALTLMAAASSPWAQGPAAASPGTGATLSINIPAQALGDALNAWARQTGMQLAVPQALVAGKSAPAVRGALSARQSLDQLLAGSGLTGTLQGNAAVIKPAPTAPLETPTSNTESVLPSVPVTASREAFQPGSLDLARDDIDRVNPRDLQDLFRGQAGIQVGSSLPMSQKLYVNGVEENNLAVSIDGSRQNNKVFHHNATTLIDPSLLKAVRVDSGVAPADAGPGALAGSVAYETLDADELLLPGKTWGGSVKGEFESNGDIATTSGSIYGKSGGFEYLGFIKSASGNLRKDGDGTTIVGSGTDLLSSLAKLAYQAESGHRFEISHESVRDDEARPYRANLGRVNGGRPTPLTRDYDLHRQNTVLTYTDQTPSGLWDPKVQLARSSTQLGISETDQLIDGKTDSFNGKFENRFRLAAGSVTAGVDFYDERAHNDYVYVPDPALNERGVEKVRNLGLYGQARLYLSEQSRVSFGARADTQRFTGVNGQRASESGWSFNLSGEHDLSNSMTLSAGYSDVWAGMPLAENLIINPAWTYDDPVKPVTADNLFVGLRTRFKGDLKGLSLDGKVFRTNIRDARTPDYRAGAALTKDMTSKGFELGASYSWSSGFGRVRYAHIDTTIDGKPADSDTGRYLTTPIGQVVSLELVQSVMQRQLSLGLDAQIVLKETDTYDVDTASRGLPLPSYEVFNAFVEAQPSQWRGLTLRGEVNNLFNKTYTSRATYGQEYGSIVPLREPGRSFKLVASYRF